MNILFFLLLSTSIIQWCSIGITNDVETTELYNNSILQVIHSTKDSIYTLNSNMQFHLKESNSCSSIEKSNYIFDIIFKSDTTPINIFSDTIYSKTGQFILEDYNMDGSLDLLIHNESDARSNWTYYLYLVYPEQGIVTKISNFNRIKNPKNLHRNNIIQSHVISGKSYYEYYKILDNLSICYFDTTIYESSGSEKNISSQYDSNTIINAIELLECISLE